MNRSIAIDGPCGAGKSTIAKAVAAALGGYYLDTGAMYRAVGVFMLRSGVDMDDAAAVEARVGEAKVDVRYNEKGEQRTLLCGEDVTDILRTPDVSTAASKTGTVGAVRRLMVKRQQELAKEFFLVCDGRDIGSVVIPDSVLKIYLTAKPEVRARRRLNEPQYAGKSFAEVLADVNDRDYRDMHRDESPLTQTEDAVVVDSSRMTPEQVVARIVKLYKCRTAFYPFKKVILKPVLAVFRFLHPFTAEGTENLPAEGAYILALNHRSALDCCPALAVTPMNMVFMAKKELFAHKITNWFMRRMNAFPVDRGANDMAAVRTAIDTLGMGRPLVIFPEGHRYTDGEIHEIKPGAALIALQSGAPLIPARIHGGYRLFGKVTLRIGTPIKVERKRAAGLLQEATAQLTEAMKKL